MFEKDTDGYGRDRDREIEVLAKKAGVKIMMEQGRTLYDSDELVKHNGGKPTMSISQVEHVSIVASATMQSETKECNLGSKVNGTSWTTRRNTHLAP